MLLLQLLQFGLLVFEDDGVGEGKCQRSQAGNAYGQEVVHGIGVLGRLIISIKIYICKDDFLGFFLTDPMILTNSQNPLIISDWLFLSFGNQLRISRNHSSQIPCI